MTITFTEEDEGLASTDVRRVTKRISMLRGLSSRTISVGDVIAVDEQEEDDDSDDDAPPNIASKISRDISRRLSVAHIPVADLEDEDTSHITPKSTEPADKIDRAYDSTTSKGAEGGLFRASMNAIRKSHHEARQIRTALILLGLFTDKDLYRDWISVFYAVNKELELKMKSPQFESGQAGNELKILKELQKLGETYYFSELYEKDLKYLYGVSTQSQLETKINDCLANKSNAQDFRLYVSKMTKASEIAGALFDLWGVFIVGGGATAKQRASKMCGDKGVNVYQNVSGPGREKRKRDFIVFWDSLAAPASDEFGTIEDSADVCMRKMNATIKDLSANPWWLKYLSAMSLAVAVGIGAVAYKVFMPKN